MSTARSHDRTRKERRMECKERQSSNRQISSLQLYCEGDKAFLKQNRQLPI
jgi:hypothetical protein